MLRCIDCGLNVFRMRRHSIDSENISSIIRQRNSLQEIPSNSVICNSCWLSINQRPGTDAPTQTVGHQNICVCCGRSLFRRRSHILRSDSEGQIHIRSVVAERVFPRQLRTSDQICHPCWQSCNRVVEHLTSSSTLSVLPSTSSVLPSTSSVLPSTSSVASYTSSAEPLTSADIETSTASLQSVLPATSSLQIIHPPEGSPPTQEATIVLNKFARAPDTQAHCFFPGCLHTERFAVPVSIRARLFADSNFYVPANCRICHYHLRGNMWHQLTEVAEVNHTFTESHVYDFTKLLRQQSTIDFENVNMMDENLVHFWFGLTKNEFQSLLAEVPRLSEMYRGSTALAAYLIKLRNGDSDERIASLFQIPRSTLENLMTKARDLLHKHFVPMHLGIRHISRQEIAQRNLLIPNGLFGGAETDGLRRPIVIADGTYIYCQKSSNYKYQKKTYSLHKYRNLVKPFLFVCCDGYIVEALGPYPATTSDAKILLNEFSEESKPLRQYFQESDVFILDRGFRDSLPLLEQCHYAVYTPSTLEEGETQLSTLEANKSRAVTICRWVVEVVNGIFKQSFKIFRQEFFNRASTHLMVDFSVAAALINRFHKRITDRSDAAQILDIINQKMFQDNTLVIYVISNNYNRRRAQFTNITVDNSNVIEFPQLSYHDLILIAFGTYQLKQARSYYGEHIRSNGSYTIEVCREAHLSDLGEELSLSENTWLLRGRIKSRHISQKIYYVYILIDNGVNGREAIQQYCCNCLVGRRTVGCCAHVMAVLWYLGWARYQNNVTPPAQFLDSILISYDNAIDE